MSSKKASGSGGKSTQPDPKKKVVTATAAKKKSAVDDIDERVASALLETVVEEELSDAAKKDLASFMKKHDRWHNPDDKHFPFESVLAPDEEDSDNARRLYISTLASVAEKYKGLSRFRDLWHFKSKKFGYIVHAVSGDFLMDNDKRVDKTNEGKLYFLSPADQRGAWGLGVKFRLTKQLENAKLSVSYETYLMNRKSAAEGRKPGDSESLWLSQHLFDFINQKKAAAANKSSKKKSSSGKTNDNAGSDDEGEENGEEQGEANKNDVSGEHADEENVEDGDNDEDDGAGENDDGDDAAGDAQEQDEADGDGEDAEDGGAEAGDDDEEEISGDEAELLLNEECVLAEDKAVELLNKTYERHANHASTDSPSIASHNNGSNGSDGVASVSAFTMPIFPKALNALCKHLVDMASTENRKKWDPAPDKLTDDIPQPQKDAARASARLKYLFEFYGASTRGHTLNDVVASVSNGTTNLNDPASMETVLGKRENWEQYCFGKLGMTKTTTALTTAVAAKDGDEGEGLEYFDATAGSASFSAGSVAALGTYVRDSLIDVVTAMGPIVKAHVKKYAQTLESDIVPIGEKVEALSEAGVTREKTIKRKIDDSRRTISNELKEIRTEITNTRDSNEAKIAAMRELLMDDMKAFLQERLDHLKDAVTSNVLSAIESADSTSLKKARVEPPSSAQVTKALPSAPALKPVAPTPVKPQAPNSAVPGVAQNKPAAKTPAVVATTPDKPVTQAPIKPAVKQAPVPEPKPQNITQQPNANKSTAPAVTVSAAKPPPPMVHPHSNVAPPNNSKPTAKTAGAAAAVVSTTPPVKKPAASPLSGLGGRAFTLGSATPSAKAVSASSAVPAGLAAMLPKPGAPAAPAVATSKSSVASVMANAMKLQNKPGAVPAKPAATPFKK